MPLRFMNSVIIWFNTHSKKNSKIKSLWIIKIGQNNFGVISKTVIIKKHFYIRMQ